MFREDTKHWDLVVFSLIDMRTNDTRMKNNFMLPSWFRRLAHKGCLGTSFSNDAAWYINWVLGSVINGT